MRFLVTIGFMALAITGNLLAKGFTEESSSRAKQKLTYEQIAEQMIDCDGYGSYCAYPPMAYKK